MNSAYVRKQPVKRAFTGLAGSSLAKIRQLAGEQKSDHTLRVPKTSDRTDPLAFEVWIDAFGQKHGQIDIDNCFQEHAFDAQLGRGVDPNVDSERSSNRVTEEDVNSPTQDLGLPSGTKIITGLLEGDRPLKRRRSTEKSWWVFDGKLLREFIRPLYNPKNMERAEKAIFVLYYYYFQNRTDEEIWDERSFFRDVKSVKQYRRALVNKGAEMFKDQKPESTWHGRRGVWDEELRAYDYSGRK
ncbi:MAG: hypothetical protein WCC97_08410 [Candidatus Acidiferrales bacterium]